MLTRFGLTLALLILPALPAAAHSIDDLEKMLGAQEKYFQPIDKAIPAFELRDLDGRTVGPADFHGKVVVLHFIYARCKEACPLHSRYLAEVQAMLNATPVVKEQLKDRVQFVTITTDPSKDTPEVLREYGPTQGFDPASWTALTIAADQPEDTTRKLAEALGHTFSTTPDGEQVHGVVTHVIDPSGRWRGNFHGLKFDPLNLVLFINGLVNEAAGHPDAHGEGETNSWWQRLLPWM